MINYIYQLVAPKLISIKYKDEDSKNNVIIRPEYMALCHADQRYYLGQRNPKVMNEKLPMALIHECSGIVVEDKSGVFERGQRVVVIPNTTNSVNDNIFENYIEGSHFLSSGHDGFMRELIFISPEQVVAYDGIQPHIAAISEFLSVAVHAINRLDLVANKNRDTIVVWGDGSLSYCVASILKELKLFSKIIVVGKHSNKLAHFSFVDEVYTVDYLPDNIEFDHAFECTGGEGSYYAIDDIIKYIRPQGSIALMGVSENKIPLNTRNILEKGITLVGCSRSGRVDFENAIKLLKNKNLQNRLATIISYEGSVFNISDIHQIFQKDLSIPFKTVFKWEV